MSETQAAKPPKRGWTKVWQVFWISLLVGWAFCFVFYIFTPDYRWHPEDWARFTGNVLTGPFWAFMVWGLWLLIKNIGRGFAFAARKITGKV